MTQFDLGSYKNKKCIMDIKMLYFIISSSFLFSDERVTFFCLQILEVHIKEKYENLLITTLFWMVYYNTSR